MLKITESKVYSIEAPFGTIGGLTIESEWNGFLKLANSRGYVIAYPKDPENCFINRKFFQFPTLELKSKENNKPKEYQLIVASESFRQYFNPSVQE